MKKTIVVGVVCFVLGVLAGLFGPKFLTAAQTVPAPAADAVAPAPVVEPVTLPATAPAAPVVEEKKLPATGK